MKILRFSVGVMMTNCYFIVDEESAACAVVDPGEDADKILAKLKDKGLRVEAILLTHGHFDHIMALPALVAATGAKVMLHEKDEALYSDNDLNCMRRFAGVDLPMPPIDRLLRESDEIAVGGSRIRVLHTPGHTEGSVCYLCGEDLITGDTLFAGSCGRSDLPGGDYRTLLSSLHRLRDLPDDYRIFPGHGTSSHLERERHTNVYLL